MARESPDLIRTASTPAGHERHGSSRSKDYKKSKSLTERLRSTFTRSKNSTHTQIKQQDDINDEITYGKIVVLGQAGVGKTSFIHRLVNNYFTDQYTPTTTSSSFEVTAIVECEETLKSRKDKLIDYAKSVRKVKSFSRSTISEQLAKQQCRTKTFKFQLVDTTEDINEASPMEYRSTVANAHGFLLLCSSDKKSSIEYIREIYQDIAEMRINTIVPVIIIQNKDDLHSGSEDDETFDSELEQLAVSLDVETCQLSTANSSGFENLTELLLNEMNVYNDDYQTELALPDEVAYSDQTEENEGKQYIHYSYYSMFKSISNFISTLFWGTRNKRKDKKNKPSFNVFLNTFHSFLIIPITENLHHHSWAQFELYNKFKKILFYNPIDWILTFFFFFSHF